MARWFGATVLFLIWGLAGGAVAETPQILALIETPAPVPLTCRGEVCRAELSSYCLQQAAETPAAGTVYMPATGGVELVLDGGRTVAASLTFASLRGHAAVAVSLPRAQLAASGARRAAVRVGPRVSLLPADLAATRSGDDPAIRLATGAWREIGRRTVEAGDGDAVQVRALNALINALPRHDAGAPAPVQTIWRDAIPAALGPDSATGLAQARRRLEACAGRVRHYDVSYLGVCLQLRHDAVLEDLNRAYWRIVGPTG